MFRDYPRHRICDGLLIRNIEREAFDVRGWLQCFELFALPISDEDVRAFSPGTLTCRNLVELYMKRIDTHDKSGPALNAVQTKTPNALADGDRLDAVFRSSGPAGPLHCIPVLVKDEIETRDMPTTYGS